MDNDVQTSVPTGARLHGLLVARDILRFPKAVEVIDGLGRGVNLRDLVEGGNTQSIEDAVAHLESFGVVDRDPDAHNLLAVTLSQRGQRLVDALEAIEAAQS